MVPPRPALVTREDVRSPPLFDTMFSPHGSRSLGFPKKLLASAAGEPPKTKGAERENENGPVEAR